MLYNGGFFSSYFFFVVLSIDCMYMCAQLNRRNATIKVVTVWKTERKGDRVKKRPSTQVIILLFFTIYFHGIPTKPMDNSKDLVKINDKLRLPKSLSNSRCGEFSPYTILLYAFMLIHLKVLSRSDTFYLTKQNLHK